MTKKITLFLVLTLNYLITMIIVYWIHINFFKVNVLLYSTLLDGLISFAMMLPAYKFTKKIINISYSGFENFLIAIIWLSLSYVLAITIPTVIDRSLSIYLLEKLQQRGGSINKKSFDKIFTNEYMVEQKIIDMRLTEQTQSKTIIIKNDCVQLTQRGSDIASFTRFFRSHFLPKNRLIGESYSDDLVDIFKHTDNNFSNEEKCQ